MTTLQPNQNDWLAVAWAPYSRMSETFARELDGKLYCIHFLRFQSKPHAPFKYLMQALRTFGVLLKERPRSVHVQNPPFVCGLVVYLYCLIFGGNYVLHYHSAAFGRAWDWALPLQKFVARRALTNIVTNQHWADIVSAWGGHTMVMLDPFLDLPEGRRFETVKGFSIAVVCTFAPDEPIDTILATTRELPNIHFYITGDKRKLPADILAKVPDNVTLTGFLDPNRDYPGLLRAADAVMVLTTRNHTLQLGGCEAVAVGKPLITSDWAYLREVFPKGTVFVSNSVESMKAGIVDVQNRYDALAEEIVALRHESRQEWDSRLMQLKTLAAQKG